MTSCQIEHHIGAIMDALYRALEAWPGSLRSLARAAGVAHSTLLRVRDGKFEPSDDVSNRIADALALAGSKCRRAADELRRAVARRQP